MLDIFLSLRVSRRRRSLENKKMDMRSKSIVLHHIQTENLGYGLQSKSTVLAQEPSLLRSARRKRRIRSPHLLATPTVHGAEKGFPEYRLFDRSTGQNLKYTDN